MDQAAATAAAAAAADSTGDGGGDGGGAFSKYQFDVPKLRCGDIADFHLGLESRIGPAAEESGSSAGHSVCSATLFAILPRRRL